MSMDLLEGHAKGVKDYGLERLIMLSDGVFAIAITLLALEIRPPEKWDFTFIGLIEADAGELIAYVSSFFLIAIYWASHRRTFQRFRRSDGVLTAINFVLLGLITLMPFANRVLAEARLQGDTFMMYMGLVTAVGVSNAALWGYAAFIGDILHEKLSLALKITILLVLLLVPSTMAAAGLMASNPKNWWVVLLLIGFSLSIAFVRRRMEPKKPGKA
ncbi:putative membrane protein [Caulobacter ginsengisoli]|uniref:Membrane protein n=1 Tax=Caulobacter ginsengisoli TaxID=400775 RepID=A0ABU0IRZ5_9CAUL|nr:TMEM175 family protein [Caulobacter ginsengisoli]MDQ0464783.1 putative membrane protein [Caulobacter ginsengisoli]